jgi:hypothetical protein
MQLPGLRTSYNLHKDLVNCSKETLLSVRWGRAPGGPFSAQMRMPTPRQLRVEHVITPAYQLGA